MMDEQVQLPGSEAAAAGMSIAELRATRQALLSIWTAAARALVPADIDIFDVHCHVGEDIDGSTIDVETLVAQMDLAGVAGATVIPLAQPDGYQRENERIRMVADASGGRLHALHRVDPAVGDIAAAADASAGLAAGARGLKWHPRAEAFDMADPAAAATAAVAAEHGVPVLIHAGRGMPNLGEGVVDMARRYPDATFVLAHAAVSDIAWIIDASRDVPNLVFDTSWFRPFDIAVLMSRAAPARLVHGSDPPYGTVAFGMQMSTRVARSCGFEDDAMRALMGGNAARILGLDGADPRPAGVSGRSSVAGPGRVHVPEVSGARGVHAVAVEDHDLRRAASYIEASMHVIMNGGSPIETIELARHALQVPSTHEHSDAAAVIDAALLIAESLMARPPQDDRLGWTMGMTLQTTEAIDLLMCALVHASTPALGVEGADLLA